MIDRFLLVLLFGLGVLLYVTLLRQMIALRERVETLMVRTDGLRRAVKRIVRQTPATRLGHMHRISASLFSSDPKPEPQWIIVDPGGRVLSTMPAKKIVDRMSDEAAGSADQADDAIVRQHSNDPGGLAPTTGPFKKRSGKTRSWRRGLPSRYASCGRPRAVMTFRYAKSRYPLLASARRTPANSVDRYLARLRERRTKESDAPKMPVRAA